MIYKHVALAMTIPMVPNNGILVLNFTVGMEEMGAKQQAQ